MIIKYTYGDILIIIGGCYFARILRSLVASGVPHSLSGGPYVEMLADIRTTHVMDE